MEINRAFLKLGNNLHRSKEDKPNYSWYAYIKNNYIALKNNGVKIYEHGNVLQVNFSKSR